MRKERTDLTYSYIKAENGMKNADEILRRTEEAGFKIIGKKLFRYTKNTAKALYGEHEGKPFYDRLMNFTCSANVIALLLEKENAVEEWRKFIGDTKKPAEGTIRYLFQIPNDGEQNVVHGTDKPKRVREEALIPFPELAYLWE